MISAKEMKGQSIKQDDLQVRYIQLRTRGGLQVEPNMTLKEEMKKLKHHSTCHLAESTDGNT
jgi:hypothetical protein